MLIDPENSMPPSSEMMDGSAADGTETEHDRREAFHWKAKHRRQLAKMHGSAVDRTGCASSKAVC